MMTSAVMVQMIRVSMKVPNMPIIPWRTGSLVWAAAWAMGALPKPASFENTPRATPNLSAAQTAAPAKPPVAAVPLNALVKINPNASPIFPKFAKMTIREPKM